MKNLISWHFPRTEIASNILDLFESYSTSAITIFAKRRMGKTEMLIEDLWPLAEKNNYEVRYTSFWMDKSSPEQVFYDSLLIKKQSYGEVKARINFLGSYIETTSDSVCRDSSKPSLQAIASQMTKLAKRKKKTLLLLDEIQQLAIGEQNDQFVAMLRTVLDTHKKKIHVVFTGSSQEGLITMFRKHKAPLFNFSHQLDLPELTSSFVNFMLNAFTEASGRKLNLAASLRVFTKVHKVPARFHDLLRAMLISGRSDIEVEFEEYKKSSGEQLRFSSEWQELKPLDKSILHAIAQGKNGLFSDLNRESYAEMIGVESVSKSTVQKSVNKLKSLGILESFNRGQYEYVELAFKYYILEKTNI